MASKPVALVIGASRGIGRQIGVTLAESGYAGMAMDSMRFAIAQLFIGI